MDSQICSIGLCMIRIMTSHHIRSIMTSQSILTDSVIVQSLFSDMCKTMTTPITNGFHRNSRCVLIESCFCATVEDLERNDGSEQKPYFMSKGLMKVLGKKNKKPKDKDKKI